MLFLKPILLLSFLLVPFQLLAAGPVILVPDADFEFGDVRQGERVVHTFVFKNTGDQPLEISKVKSSCGCTAALVDQRQVAPGEQGEVRVNFDSSRFRGRVGKTVYLYSNDPENQMVQLHLRGTITAELQLSSNRLQMGPTAVGSLVKATVTLTNLGNQSVQLSQLRTTLPEVTASLDRTELSTGEKAAITLQATPKVAGKNLSGYLFCATSNPNKPELRLPFSILVN